MSSVANAGAPSSDRARGGSHGQIRLKFSTKRFECNAKTTTGVSKLNKTVICRKSQNGRMMT